MLAYLTDRDNNNYENICKLYGKPLKNSDEQIVRYQIAKRSILHTSESINGVSTEIAFINVDGNLIPDMSKSLNVPVTFYPNCLSSKFGLSEYAFDGIIVIEK